MSLLDQAVIDSCEIGAKIELEKLRDAHSNACINYEHALEVELDRCNAALIELAGTHKFRMRQWADEVARLKSENAAFYAEKERLRAELIACRVLKDASEPRQSS